MRSAIFALTMILSQKLLAAPVLISPFPPDKGLGIDIHNTHLVANGESLVLRGQRPMSAYYVKQLTDQGISQVLIFRNNVPGEDTVAEERLWLEENPKIKAIYEIPFKWKDITNFQEACEQTMEALRIMKNSTIKKDAGLFFHCTVGEDRTGYLAGLYRMIFEKKTAEDVFQNEMCRWGYADGNSKARGINIKPPFVVEAIHEAITPTFAKMAAMIKAGKITADNLDEGVCAKEPKLRPSTINKFRCEN